MLPGDMKDDPQALQTHVSKLLQEGKFMYKGLNLEVSIASWCKIYYEHYILPIDIHCLSTWTLFTSLHWGSNQ